MVAHTSSIQSHGFEMAITFTNLGIMTDRPPHKQAPLEVISARDSSGRTPLHVACAAGWAEGAGMLLRAGAALDQADGTHTPVMLIMHVLNRL